jgi:predicted enzyme related to lactoylglutathione lyase
MPRKNAVTIAFKVQDLASQRDALAAKGVEFWSEGEQEWGRYAHFTDPEGNQLQLYEPNPGY